MTEIINDSTEIVALDAVHPHPDNPRMGDLGAIIQSVEANGFYGQVVVQKATGRILAGNHRWMAAKHAGLSEIPVTFVDVDDERARRILIADNRTSDLGTYDDAVLAGILKDLAASEMGLDGTGYDGDDLDALLEDLGEGHPFGAVPARTDEADVLREKWGVEDGQLWQIGNHRIVCGDSTDPSTYDRLLADALADMVFTDPPYGVEYNGGAKPRRALAGDERGTDIYGKSLPLIAAHTRKDGAFYIWYADAHAAAAAAAAAGIVIRAQVIWVKNNAQFMSTAHYHGKHEPCFYGGRKGALRWFGDTNEVTVWEEPRSASNDYHPTQKPVALAERAIRNSSERGDAVLDAFLGGGSTLVACEQASRIGYGVEIDPGYVAVTLERLAEMGLTPERVQ